MKKITRHILPVFLSVAVFLAFPAIPAYAIDPPDSNPTVESIDAYRNVLETGDFLVIIYQNTPYGTTPPDFTYREAFVWRWFGSDNTTELGQALGSAYQDKGFGYNVISFYFNEVDAPDWDIAYNFTLSGTPAAFETIPIYTFTIASGDYSSLTDTAEVKNAIADWILETASDLNIRWGRTEATSLVKEEDVGTLLSLYGQTYFRGAIYGVQAMAPSLFDLRVGNIPTEYKTWSTEYADDLATQLAGTYLETATEAGKALLDVDYNLFGLLLVMAVCGVLIGSNWMLAGGMSWRGLVDSSAVMVIGGRLALLGLGELALVAAIAWLYVSAKFWRMI